MEQVDGTIFIDILRSMWTDGLLFYFDAADAAIPPGADEACLTGSVAGLPFEACGEL